MISEYEVKSISNYLDLIDSGNIFGIKFYRGHSDKAWSLTPSLFRLNLINNFGDKWIANEHILLSKFKRIGYPYIKNESKNIIDLICLAQHHGIPTRLLDWTENPLVALFFAVEDEIEHIDAAVWRIEDTKIVNKIPANNYKELREYTSQKRDNILIYRPIHLTKRIFAQKGCFSIHDVPRDSEPIKPIENTENIDYIPYEKVKFIIKGKLKKDIKEQLDKLGVNYATLFPDLDGLCKHIKWQTETESRNVAYDYDNIIQWFVKEYIKKVKVLVLNLQN